MESIVKRFRDRKNLPTIVSVSWPKENPEFVFEIARFADEEITGAKFDAEAILKRRGVVPPPPAEIDAVTEKAISDEHDEARIQYTADFLASQFYALAGIVWKHLKGWKHTPPEGTENLEYSQPIAVQLFKGLQYWERVSIGVAYSNALEQLQKKSGSAPSSEPASSSS